MEENNLQQQEVETAETVTAEVCANCGEPLGEEQAFCPKCGTARKAESKETVCTRCGAELAEGQEFCSKCGQKVGLEVDDNVASAINQFHAGVDKQNQKKKKTPIIVGAVIVIVILAAVSFKTVAPKIFIDAEGYMAQGNYEKAYEKAKSDEEKLEVKAENMVAVQSANSADNLKDPSSFSLRDAYYNEELNDDGEATAQIVLVINGANSYGANVSSYWYYTWDQSDKEWERLCAVSELSDEEYSEYDDDDEKIEKLVNNIGRLAIRNIMSDGIKLSKASVKRINTLFEEDRLDDVDMLDVELGFSSEI